MKIKIKILSLSDTMLNWIYSPQVRERFWDIDLVLGCGDIPYYYLEFIVSALNVPTYYVRGNHAERIEYNDLGTRTEPEGAIDLHRRVVNHNGLLLAGVEGSLRYNQGAFQYTQAGMWVNIFTLIPFLFYNRIRHGKYLDIFVSHASPWGIHDQADLPHRGIKAFRWFLKVFKPKYHFHGHVHLYRPDMIKQTLFQETTVVNSYGYQETEMIIPL